MVRIALGVLNGFVALTAIGGGIALMAGLEGDRFPQSLLVDTPFKSYLMPGAILAIAVGGSAATATAIAILRPADAALASMAAGLVLVGWITGEVMILRSPAARSWTEALYLAIGLATVGISVAVAGRPGGV